jgi:hypothetical protein
MELAAAVGTNSGSADVPKRQHKRRMRAATKDSNRHRYATQCCAAQRRHPDAALRRVCAIVAG